MKVVIIFLLYATFSYGGLLIRPEEVLQELFPNHNYMKKSFLLGKKERKIIEKEFKTKVRSSLFTVYLIREKDKTIGYALLHSHRVRTKKETILVTMDKNCKVIDVEIIAFYEPPEFILPEKWLKLLNNRSDENLPFVRRNIPNVTGSTLSAQVITDALRQTLGICKYYLKEKFQ